MKPVSSAEDGILTSIYRKIIIDTGTINSLGFFITRYIKNKGSKNKATVTKITLDGEMTWKSFVFLIFEIHRVKKMKIKITLTPDVGVETEHELEFTPLHASKNTGEEDKTKGDKR